MSDVALLKAKVADLTSQITQLQADLRMVQTAFADAVNKGAAARQSIAALLAYVQHGRTCQRWSEAWEWPIVLNHGKPCTCGLAALTAPEAKGMREDAP